VTRRPPSYGRLFAIGTLAVFVLLVLLPLGAALALTFTSEDGPSIAAYRAILTGSRQWGLLVTTLTIACGTAAASTLLGAPIGFALEYLRVPGRRALSWLVAVPFLIPPYVGAVAWIALLGNNGVVAAWLPKGLLSALLLPGLYTVPGVILVLTLSHFPLVTLAAAVALRRYEWRYEEAGRLARPSLAVFAHITLPLVLPGVLTGALFVFMLALVGFAVPSLLQVNAYPVEIYTRFSALCDSAGAIAQAWPLVLVGGSALLFWGRCIRPKHRWLTGGGCPAVGVGGKALCTVAAACCWAVVGLAALLPLSVLVWRSMPASSYLEVWQTAKEEMMTSFLVAASSATLLTTLALCMACVARERRWASRGYAISLAAFLMSGPALGVALIAVWNRHGLPGLVYDSLAILVLACTARFLFFAYQGVGSALSQLNPSIEEAARVCGVPWRRRLLGLIVPLLWPTLLAVWGVTFLLSLREVDATVLVCPPGATTLPVRLFTLMHYGPSRLVAALSVLTVAAALLVGAVTALAYARAKAVLNARG